MNQYPNITITITPQYLEKRSDPNQQRYCFSYNVQLENKGQNPVQMISQQLTITEENGESKTIENDQIIINALLIKPQAIYQHESATILSSASGLLEGHCTFSADDGEPFEVKIPKSFLIIPRSLH